MIFIDSPSLLNLIVPTYSTSLFVIVNSSLKKPTLGLRLKNNKCEWCGKETNNLKVYQVKKLKDLTDEYAWNVFMKSINRKTLVVCNECFEKINDSNEE